ncbi:MAG: carbonic anhydrase [Candidatus Omnitrophota bacterium]
MNNKTGRACAANPAGKEEHHRQIKNAAQNMKKWNLGVDVYGAWVDKDWKAELI